MKRFAVTLVCLLLAGSFALAAPEALPTWKIAELKTLGDGWGTDAKEGQVAFRPVQAGKTATFTVPVWWGKDNRPPEGTIYLLTVSYKDTATQPVIFSSHAGHGSYWGLSEVHRFGGAGDGQWKKAQVPLSWDLVIRKNALPWEPEAPKDVTEFGIYANKDLPVESIAVTMASPAAAGRYGQETRAWIARAQDSKLAKADQGRKQQPVIPDGFKGKALVPYVRSYMVELMPNAAPQKDEAGATLKVRMARNEFEPAAFAVYANGTDLKGVNYSVSELTGPAGKLECELDCRTAEYAVVQEGRGGKFSLSPQRYWPVYPVDIAAGKSHSFWITLKTLGEKTKPGLYKGKVTVTQPVGSSAAPAELPIEVEVLPIMLPTMKECGFELGTCGFATQQELKTLFDNNHTGLDIWFGGCQQQMRVRDGKLEMSFYYLDDWMAQATKLGMTHMMWFMGGDPYGFPDTVNLERDLCRSQEGNRDQLRRDYIAKSNANPDKVLPEIRDLYVQWVRQTAEHAKKNNWPGKLIIHPFDEPAKYVQKQVWENPFAKVLGAGPWIKPHFQDACALIREGGKGFDNILTGGDMHHAEPSMVFLKDVDVFCTNAIHEDQKLGEKVRAAGVQFWQYSGGGDHAPAHRGRFTFGWYFGAYDSRGGLIWAYISRRFDTSEGANYTYGWYTPFGTVWAPYMAGVREGWDDRRWIELYKKTVLAKDAAGKALLDGIFKDAIAQRTSAGTNTITDFFAEMKQHQQMDDWRNKLMDEIIKAQAR